MGEVLYFPCTNKTIMTVAEAIEILYRDWDRKSPMTSATHCVTYH